MLLCLINYNLSDSVCVCVCVMYPAAAIVKELDKVYF